MPIYEYNCPTCGTFEVMQAISEKPITKCPTCKGKKVKKLISESSFHLKGSGWYQTDYGKGKGCPKTDAKPGGNGDSEKKSEKKESCAESCSKADSCPAAKTEAPASAD